MTTYLLDSDVFMEAKKRWYGLDFCPGFWNWLDQSHAAGTAFSVEKVLEEIRAGDDDLIPWVNARKSMFLVPDAEVISALATITNWLTSQTNYTPAAVQAFLDAADSYLTADALAHGHTVVTHEKAVDTPNKVKIPNACAQFEIPTMNTFDFLRTEGARLII